eukprot:PhF_6_TR43105/c0_g1_i2/m.65869
MNEEVDFLMERLLDEEEKTKSLQASVKTLLADVQNKDSSIKSLEDEIHHLKKALNEVQKDVHGSTDLFSVLSETVNDPATVDRLSELEHRHRALILQIQALESHMDLTRLQIANTYPVAKVAVAKAAHRVKARIVNGVMKRLRSEIFTLRTLQTVVELAHKTPSLKPEVFMKTFIAIRASIRTVAKADLSNNSFNSTNLAPPHVGLEWVSAGPTQRQKLSSLSNTERAMLQKHFPAFVVSYELHRESVIAQYPAILEELVANELNLLFVAQLLFQGPGEDDYAGTPESLQELSKVAGSVGVFAVVPPKIQPARTPRRMPSPINKSGSPGGPSGVKGPGGPVGGSQHGPTPNERGRSSEARKLFNSANGSRQGSISPTKKNVSSRPYSSSPTKRSTNGTQGAVGRAPLPPPTVAGLPHNAKTVSPPKNSSTTVTGSKQQQLVQEVPMIVTRRASRDDTLLLARGQSQQNLHNSTQVMNTTAPLPTTTTPSTVTAHNPAPSSVVVEPHPVTVDNQSSSVLIVDATSQERETKRQPPPAPPAPSSSSFDCFLSPSELAAIKASSYGFQLPRKVPELDEYNDLGAAGLRQVLEALSDNDSESTYESPPRINPPKYTTAPLQPDRNILKRSNSLKKEGVRVMFV